MKTGWARGERLRRYSLCDNENHTNESAILKASCNIFDNDCSSDRWEGLLLNEVLLSAGNYRGKIINDSFYKLLIADDFDIMSGNPPVKKQNQ